MDEIARLLKLLNETQDRLHKVLGLSQNEWRRPEDFTDKFWAVVAQNIFWSDDPLTVDGDEPYSSPALGQGIKTLKNYTVVELDHGMGDGLSLTVFANNKQCKDPAVLEALAEM